jgi:hypothetical protein
LAAIETVLGFCWEFSRAVGADERESGPALQAKLRRRWIFVLAATTWHLRRLDVDQYRPFTGRTALLHPLRTFALLFIFRPRFLLQPPREQSQTTNLRWPKGLTNRLKLWHIIDGQTDTSRYLMDVLTNRAG